MLELARIAWKAERFRWRLRLRRGAVQVGLIGFSACLLLVAAIACEMALYALLAERLPPAGAAGGLALGNAVLSLLAALLALSSKPSQVERDAAELATVARSQLTPSSGGIKLVLQTLFRLLRHD